MRPRRALLGLVAAMATGLAPAQADADQLNFAADQCYSNCWGAGVSAEGSSYLSDRSARRLHVFGPDGTLKRSITGAGGVNLTEVTDLERLPDGNLAVSSFLSDIQVMTPDGALVASYAGSSGAGDLAADPAGNLYWTVANAVRKRDAVSGETSEIFAHPNGYSTQLQGIAFNAADGLLYAVNHTDSTVQRLHTDGAPMGTFGSYGDGPTELNKPTDITVDDSGNLYLAQGMWSGGNAHVQRGIKKFTPSGSPAGFYAPVGFSSPHKLDWHNGALVVLMSSSGAFRLDLDDPIVALSGPAQIRTGQRATFSATGSLPFGSITRHEWDLDGDGSFETDTGPTPTVTRRYDAEGDGVARVRATGSRGRTDTAQVALKVGRSAAALAAPGQVLTGQTFVLDASASAQPNSDITSVRFDRDGDGTFEFDAGTSLRAETSYTQIGAAAAGVQVTREGGTVDVARRAITVRLAPPAGPVGASINAGAKYTNDPNVHVGVVWPAFAELALVANDGGFRGARSFPVAATVPATLDSSGPERLPKTVYVRFDASAQTLTDDIILDETRPQVTAGVLTTAGPPAATAAAAKRRRFEVSLNAIDRTSGVATVQFARARSKPSPAIKYARRVTVRAASAPTYVRAQDRAGNHSAWKKLKLKRKERPQRAR